MANKATQQIPLTQGEYALIDKDDFEKVNQYKWYFTTQGYARRASWNKKDKKLEWVLMHRFILDVPKGLHTDHINGNTLDNRKENLRICTRTQNMKNRKNNKNNKSGYKGVSWHKQHEKWGVNIGVNGKKFHIGYFDSLKDAALARKQATRKYHREFSNI